MKKKKSKKISEEVVYIFRERLIENIKEYKMRGMIKEVLRAVSWNHYETVIEKRQFMFNEVEDRWVPRKSAGLHMDDIDFILDNWENVKKKIMEFEVERKKGVEERRKKNEERKKRQRERKEE